MLRRPRFNCVVSETDESGAVCLSCGRQAESRRPLDWTLDVVDGRKSWICLECTRENVRAIESKLAREWW